jgi:vitamin B12 transporter
MNRLSLVAASVAAVLSSASVLAQGPSQARAPEDPLDRVVITATRANEGVRADLLGASFSILQPEDFEQRQTRYVSDILRDVPGVSVNRAGSLGGLTDVRIRGTESNHTLVLIDGIKASDPVAGAFDFASFIADDVAKVEVLRGQQSALYGSDAIGGVINYITLSGREAPGGRVRVEGGSFGTKDVSARYAGVSGPLDYVLSGGWTDTDGFRVSRFGTRDVGTENGGVSTRLAYEASDTLRFKLIARYSHTKADSDPQDPDPTSPTFGYVIDGDDYYTNRAYYGLVRGELDTFDGHWTHALTAQGVDSSRDSFEQGALLNGDSGKRQRYSYESTLRFGSEQFAQTLTGAFDREREQYRSRGLFVSPEGAEEHSITNNGIVVQYDARIQDRIGLGAAFRHDDNDRFANDNTYRVQASVRVASGTRLRAAAGSGVKNPGVYDLFGFDPRFFVGNPDLRPEKSHGWEVGVDQSFAERRVLAGVTYFNSKLKDEIQSTIDFLSVENSGAESTQKGVEVFLQGRIDEAWRVDASYTYLDAKQNDGEEELRRPSHMGSLSVSWRAPEDRAGVSLTVRYNGSMNDSAFIDPSFTPVLVRLSSYTLVNLGADYRITHNVQVYGRVENLLDEQYEEVFSYRSAGRGAFLGARMSF